MLHGVDGVVTENADTNTESGRERLPCYRHENKIKECLIFGHNKDTFPDLHVTEKTVPVSTGSNPSM